MAAQRDRSQNDLARRILDHELAALGLDPVVRRPKDPQTQAKGDPEARPARVLRTELYFKLAQIPGQATARPVLKNTGFTTDIEVNIRSARTSGATCGLSFVRARGSHATIRHTISKFASELLPEPFPRCTPSTGTRNRKSSPWAAPVASFSYVALFPLDQPSLFKHISHHRSPISTEPEPGHLRSLPSNLDHASSRESMTFPVGHATLATKPFQTSQPPTLSSGSRTVGACIAGRKQRHQRPSSRAAAAPFSRAAGKNCKTLPSQPSHG